MRIGFWNSISISISISILIRIPRCGCGNGNGTGVGSGNGNRSEYRLPAIGYWLLSKVKRRSPGAEGGWYD